MSSTDKKFGLVYINFKVGSIKENLFFYIFAIYMGSQTKFEEQKNKFGICVKCNNLKTDFNWCPSCDCAQLIKNFNNWTSGNDKLDKFIQYTQSTAKSYLSYLEW